MYRTHNCGELRKSDIGKQVSLSGWVQKMRDKGFMIWVDLRDRYGISQLIFDEQRTSKDLLNQAKSLGREFVIQIDGEVIERASKNQNIPTGDIEILVKNLTILNSSTTPPFTIEDNTDGGEELRMKYRYLDIRREPIKKNLILRHQITQQVRKYLSDSSFIEVETPCLIKSTPEGARDFIVPSRTNEGEFYALPQSPQTFKQLLMVAGLDKYFQIVKCFRDEDLRADRQPEFTQIDCEMAFVKQDDILNTFEGLIVDIFKKIKKIDLNKFPKITYDQAIEKYGTDQPDIRFGMEFVELNEICQHKNFNVFNSAELVVGIAVTGGNTFTRKEIEKYIDWIKTPQVGAMGMVYVRCNDNGEFKSSVDKFYDQTDLKNIAKKTNASKGDLIMILSGDKNTVRSQLSALRLEVAKNLGLRNSEEFAPLWVVDFPLLSWNEEEDKFHAMHHPFTAPKPDQIELLKTSPGSVKANAYDLVINGNEIGGGSIRIHDKSVQEQMFKCLGFTKQEAEEQFGFLMNAFQYGAPPHGGIAFGLDRLVAILGGSETIRDFIAFPKNNAGRDVMIDSPSKISPEQLKELKLKQDL
ncbi:MAG: aspartate--tRNA ligase [Flavobacteriaceae bacterium]|nr:aspartate--tRNA ligase [Flavobacteriaceae bacterium]